MDIALLNTRVTFQKKTVTMDEIGNQIVSWEDCFSCAATISGEGGGETFAAASEEDRSDMAVTVRWCKKTEAVTMTDCRILFQDAAYDINRIDHMSFKKKSIKFFCRKERK
ncbi:MAG: phage head closure protein [Eubacteriaceae bacterium]|jgi:SPP1 family predicted phage head-tail adaptor|nr:phage head closure protein [Eubacteriaceae bacterium]